MREGSHINLCSVILKQVLKQLALNFDQFCDRNFALKDHNSRKIGPPGPLFLLRAWNNGPDTGNYFGTSGLNDINLCQNVCIIS